MISPVVWGNQSDSRATQARATADESLTSQPRGARGSHTSSNSLKPGMDLAASVRSGPGRHQVHPHPLWPQVTGQVARRRLEGGLGHPHPVVGRPRHAGVEVEPDEGASVAHEGDHGVGQGLVGVGRDVHGHRHVGPFGVEERAAQAHLGGEADGVEGAVDAVPTLGQLVAQRVDLGRVAHVELDHVGLDRQLAGRAPGQRQASPGSGEDDLGALRPGPAGPPRTRCEASVRTPVITMRFPSSRPMRPPT